VGRYRGKGTRGQSFEGMDQDKALQAHLYILNNIDEVQPYLHTHKSIIKKNNPRMNEKWLLNKHNKTFVNWFHQTIVKDNTTSDTLKQLASGLLFDVICWSAYDINKLLYKVPR